MRSKRDTTVLSVRGSERTSSSAILMNMSHIAFFINGEYRLI